MKLAIERVRALDSRPLLARLLLNCGINRSPAPCEIGITSSGLVFAQLPTPHGAVGEALILDTGAPDSDSLPVQQAWKHTDRASRALDRQSFRAKQSLKRGNQPTGAPESHFLLVSHMWMHTVWYELAALCSTTCSVRRPGPQNHPRTETRTCHTAGHPS